MVYRVSHITKPSYVILYSSVFGRFGTVRNALMMKEETSTPLHRLSSIKCPPTYQPGKKVLITITEHLREILNMCVPKTVVFLTPTRHDWVSQESQTL